MKINSTFLTKKQKQFLMTINSSDTAVVKNLITVTIPKTATEQLTGFYDKVVIVNGVTTVIESNLPLPPDPTFAMNLNFTTACQTIAQQYFGNLP